MMHKARSNRRANETRRRLKQVKAFESSRNPKPRYRDTTRAHYDPFVAVGCWRPGMSEEQYVNLTSAKVPPKPKTINPRRGLFGLLAGLGAIFNWKAEDAKFLREYSRNPESSGIR